MRITCTQENLAKAFSFLERVTGKQTSLPILANFLLQTEKGRIKLSATNLEIGVIAYVNAKIEGMSETVAPAKILSTFIHNLPGNEVVDMEIDSDRIRVSSGGHTMQVRGFDVKDFPLIPTQKSESAFSFPAQGLKMALQRLFPCVSLNESRLELTGMNFIFEGNTVRIAATDSFRLGEQVLSIPEKLRGEGYIPFTEEHSSFILPFITAQEIVRAVSTDTEAVKVAFEDNQAFFDVDGLRIVSRIINGKYPDYQQILPKEFIASAKVSREDFLRAVRLSSVFASQINGEMSLGIDAEKNEMILDARSSNIGENQTKLHAEVSGSGSIRAVFNPRYLTDGLNVLDSEEVTLQMNNASSPAGLRAVSDDPDLSKFVYIAMPIRK